MSRLRSRAAVAIGLSVVIAGVLASVPTASSALAGGRVVYAQGSVFGLSASGKVALSSQRVLAASSTIARARASMSALLALPARTDRAFGIWTAIPRSTVLRSITISGTTATVNLSRPFAIGQPWSLRQRTAQVVYSLTAVPAISRVAFSIEGNRVARIGATGPVVGSSTSRSSFDLVTPAALVTSTRPGTHVTSPFTVSGTATSFEAVVHWTLLTLNNKVLARGTTMASNSYRGSFHVTVRTSYRGSVHFVVGGDSPASSTTLVDPARTPLFIQ